MLAKNSPSEVITLKETPCHSAKSERSQTLAAHGSHKAIFDAPATSPSQTVNISPSGSTLRDKPLPSLKIGRPLPSQQSILSAYHRHPSDTFGLTIAIPTLSQIKIKPSFASGLQSAKITNEFKSPRVLATSLVSKNRRFLSPRAGTPCYPTPCLTSSSRFQIAN